MDAMRTLGGHPNIAECIEIFQDVRCLYMVTPANRGGDLTALRERGRANGVPMVEDWWRILFRQCFEALAYMHGNALMHCDIKEANIMLRTEDLLRVPEVVIIDLGLVAAMAGQDIGGMGTLGYIPPETWSHGKWFPRGDVFSMGVVIVQLLSDKVPDKKQGKEGLFTEGCRGPREIKQATMTREPQYHLMEVQTPDFVGLCRGCLQKARRSRPKAPQALANPWFSPR